MTEPNNMTEPTGMTLRDYFAGKALAGALHGAPNDVDVDYFSQFTASRIYMIADAMLEARKKGGEA